ncbi:MYPU_1760 family metalloprotease [Metamycoplasma buccale]|uniref:MYPU_1760 family metalloprotease n=1 Tax=Metamycoplasma buccale TaxID=55602 RepID=UPI00398F8946
MSLQNKKRLSKLALAIIFISSLILGIAFFVLLYFGIKAIINLGEVKKTAESFAPITVNSKKNKIEYQYGKLTLVEYAYKKDAEGNPVYFLGKEGLKTLSEEFAKRASYGPEINSLKTVYINKPRKGVNENTLNGYYIPTDYELYLPIKHFFTRRLNHSWENEKIQNKVEMLLPTLIHEYMHHVANVYNSSNKKNDPYSDNSLNYFLTNERKIIENYTNNKEFLTNFRKYLGFTKPKNKNDYLTNPSLFSNIDGSKPIFKRWNTYDIFENANVTPNPDFNDLDLSQNYNFNNNHETPIRFANYVTLSKLNYLYSFEELIPREYLKMSYAPKYIGYDGFLNYVYFTNGDFNYVTAIGDDILRSIGGNLIKKLYSYNWVFDRELKNFKNANGEYPYKIANEGINTRLKGLFKTYLNLYGYGQNISYLENKENDIVNLGGYLNLTEDDSKKKTSLLLTNLNDPTQVKEINLNVFKSNFIAKKQWDQKSSEEFYYPDFVGLKKSMYAYYSNDFSLNDLKKFSKDSLIKAELWVDKNNNNKIDSGEVMPITNQNSYLREQETKRTITNYRKHYDWNENFNKYWLENSYQIKTTEKDSKYYLSFLKY